MHSLEQQHISRTVKIHQPAAYQAEEKTQQLPLLSMQPTVSFACIAGHWQLRRAVDVSAC